MHGQDYCRRCSELCERNHTSVKERRKSKIRGTVCAQDMNSLRNKLHVLAEESFAKRSVTEMTTSAGEPPQSASGAGPKYGSVIHRCLEWMAAGREPGTHDIERLCEEFELDSKPLERITAELQKVKQSGLWQRAMNASERHAEMPFSVFLERNVFVSGVIDLVFKENGRWYLVDFKTDRIAGKPKRMWISIQDSCSFTAEPGRSLRAQRWLKRCCSSLIRAQRVRYNRENHDCTSGRHQD